MNPCTPAEWPELGAGLEAHGHLSPPPQHTFRHPGPAAPPPTCHCQLVAVGAEARRRHRRAAGQRKGGCLLEGAQVPQRQPPRAVPALVRGSGADKGGLGGAAGQVCDQRGIRLGVDLPDGEGGREGRMGVCVLQGGLKRACEESQAVACCMFSAGLADEGRERWPAADPSAKKIARSRTQLAPCLSLAWRPAPPSRTRPPGTQSAACPGATP